MHSTLFSATRLPAELLSCVAHHLSYGDVCSAVNVSHRWRGALLADSSLWTCIQMSIHSSNCGRWLSILRTLIGRSAGRPLSLELYCNDIVIKPDTAGYCAMERVADCVSGYMDRMKRLNLSIPTCTTDAWTRCLQQPAPLLEFFAIYNHTCFEVPRLPIALFGGHAPCLRGLSFENTYFPVEFFDNPSAALEHVTELYFYTGGLLDDNDMLVFLDGLPNLRQLTVTGVISYDPLEYEYEQAIELRLNAAEGVEQAVAGFLRVESVVYSFGAGHEASHVPGLIESALSSRAPVTSLDIAWTPGEYHKIFSSRPDAPEGYHSVVVNGRPLLVDVHIDRLHAALTAPEVTNALARNLRSLAVVDSLWPLIASAEMPALEALTVYLRAPQAGWGADVDGSVFCHTPAHLQRALHDLRFSRSPGRQHCPEYFRIPAALLVAFIQNTVAPECRPSLYLKGIFAVGEAVDALSGITARTVFEECSTFVEPEPWRWDIIMEDAVVPAPKEDA